MGSHSLTMQYMLVSKGFEKAYWKQNSSMPEFYLLNLFNHKKFFWGKYYVPDILQSILCEILPQWWFIHNWPLKGASKIV